MKVLFTLDSLGHGGTEKSTLDILSHFSDDISVKVMYFFPYFELKPEYEKAGIALEFADLKGKRSFIQGTRALIKVIRKEKPDLIVSSIMRANFFSRIAGKITGTPVIGTFVSDSYGDIRIAEKKSKNQYRGFRFFWQLDKFTARIPAYFISNAIAIAKSNAKALHLPAKKIKVIYRGRDASAFPEWKPSQPAEKFHFVFVGRLLESKGLRELVTAFSKVKVKQPEVHLDIYGEGGFRKTLEKMIAELDIKDHVRLHGRVAEGWKKLYDADCFVFPSWYEGFSGALVEAMMTGIPIIASDIPMNLEAVDSSTALLYPVKDAEALAGKMEEVIVNYPLRVEAGKLAREKAADKFDIRKIAAEYESFLKSVVNNTVDTGELI